MSSRPHTCLITPFSRTSTCSSGRFCSISKRCVMMIKLLSGVLVVSRSSATCLTAFTSSPESISSRMIYFGLRSLIWRTSIFLFSPQLNPTLRSLQRKSFGISSSCIKGSMIFLKEINVVGVSAFAS